MRLSESLAARAIYAAISNIVRVIYAKRQCNSCYTNTNRKGFLWLNPSMRNVTHTVREANPPIGTQGEPVENFSSKAFSSSLSWDTTPQNHEISSSVEDHPSYYKAMVTRIHWIVYHLNNNKKISRIVLHKSYAKHSLQALHNVTIRDFQTSDRWVFLTG